MWLFLITEILFFSGLFVLYAVYRARHPEVFADAHQYLDKTLGAVNTVVLLFSSLTMAWAVRCAQLTQRRGLIVCLITTLACASLFLGIKAIEYSHKWDMGLFWAGMFQPHGDHHADHGLSPFLLGLSAPAMLALIVFATGTIVAYVKKQPQALIVWGGLAIASAAFFVGVGSAMIIPKLVGPLMPAAHHERPPSKTTRPTMGHMSMTENPPRRRGRNRTDVFLRRDFLQHLFRDDRGPRRAYPGRDGSHRLACWSGRSAAILLRSISDRWITSVCTGTWSTWFGSICSRYFT
jgi:hypothetical protein